MQDLEVTEAAPGFFRARGSCSQLLIPDHALRFLPASRVPIEGKGETREAALRSGLGEAVERYSILHHGDERRVRATRNELGPAAVDPRQITLFSERQYRRRAWWRRHHGAMHWSTEPFDDSCEIDWVEARNAWSGAIRWLPAECCLLGYGGRFAQADSNGCASGNSRGHAARNALLELIERDAVAIWWYNRLRRPQVRWESFSSARVKELARLLRRRGRRFWLLDVTTDIGVPVYVAVSCDRDGAAVMLGSGAGLCAETAAWRALLEMISHVLDLNGGPPPRWPDRLADHGYLNPLPRYILPKLRAPRPPSVEFRSCLRLAHAAGLDVLLYAHTRPELGIPVVRAVVPGLRNWWARLAPGRLYDVPVRMGWRPTPITERDLNPLPYFL